MGAMPLLKRAADGGHAAAQALYALILDRADEDVEALEYYRRAAEQGDPDGQFGYGAMLASGEGGRKDPVEARRWVLAAAKQGHAPAINEMALAYLNGGLALSETERQSPEALEWIRRAAEQNFLPAMQALADAYAKGGLGLTPDRSLAEEWAAKVRKLRGIEEKKRRGGRK